MMRIVLAAVLLTLAVPAAAEDSGQRDRGRIVLEIVPSGRSYSTQAREFEIEQTAIRSVVVTRGGNLRLTPGTDGEVIGHVTPGERLAVTGKVAGRPWYETVRDGRRAYVGTMLVEADVQDVEMLAEEEDVRDLLGRISVLRESGATP